MTLAHSQCIVLKSISVLGEGSENETNAEHRTKMCRKLLAE